MTNGIAEMSIRYDALRDAAAIAIIRAIKERGEASRIREARTGEMSAMFDDAAEHSRIANVLQATAQEILAMIPGTLVNPQLDLTASRVRDALAWYAEQVGHVRKNTSEGNEARRLLDADAGSRADAALRALQGDPA